MDAGGRVKPVPASLCGLVRVVYTRAMRLRIPSRSAARSALLASVLLLPGASPADAQQRDARLPDPGDLWLELGLTLDNWTEQFGDGESGAGGGREPAYSNFDGPLAQRLYPGPLPLIEDLNSDAAVLGFDPIVENDFSMGRLDYQNLNAQMRRLSAGFELGVFRRIALGVRVPFVISDVEPAFVFDSLSATVMGALSAFPADATFFEDSRVSLGQLDALIAGGTLTGPTLDEAIQLRAETDAFLTALEIRAGGERLVPTGTSAAGAQMRALFTGFGTRFDSLGLSLPDFILPDHATAADVRRFLEDAPVSGLVPTRARSSLSMPEFEVSARIGLLDQITPRSTADLGAESGPVPDSSASAAGAARRGIRFRTALGGLVRIPRLQNGLAPMADPMNFLNLPVGDGQTDIEMSVYQDVAWGSWLMLRAVGRYGIQMADELTLRVRSPDRPYAFASTEAVLKRDLGDYAEIVLRPSIRFNSAIWIGLEYDFWKLGDTKFAVIEPTAEVPDASPLELETSQTRHMLGVGFTYDLSEARSRDDVLENRLPVRSPWQFTIGIRRAFAGSGGRTPATFRYMATFRIPIAIF